MSEFNIRFTGEELVDEGVRLAHLTLTLGTFVEEMDADLTIWSTGDYEHQWHSEIAAIVGEHDRGALITSIPDPDKPNRIWTWPMWREAETIYFRNRLMFMLEIGSSFEPALVRNHVGDRKELNEDGIPISQWELPLQALKDFLKAGALA